MTFAEADAQYEVVKQQYLAGALDDDQFDEQLHRLMVADESGVWWAKSRENGDWHYYDSATGSWIAAAPPKDKLAPPAPPPAAGAAGTAKAASAKTGSATGSKTGAQTGQAKAAEPARSEPGAGAPAPAGEELPKWAAVQPAASTARNPLTSSRRAAAAASSPLPGTAQGAPGTADVSTRDFGPLPELTGGMKVLFYALSLLVPVLGIVLYFVYRNKPAPPDRSAARAFLILGIASLVFTGMCITTFYLFESLMVGTGT